MLACTCALPAPVHAQHGNSVLAFDREALRKRGLDPALADLFRDGPRFPPGPATVAVVVNGQPRGRATLCFDREGALWLDDAALDALRLQWPARAGRGDTMERRALQEIWPDALQRLEPAQQRVQLQLPVHALRSEVTAQASAQGGGAAAMLNYDLSVSHVRAPSGMQSTYNAFTTLGLNVSDWVIRSRQSVSSEGVLHWLDTRAERSLPMHALRLQLGELSSANPLFPGAAVTGIQLLPETALHAGAAAPSAVVEGLATGPAWVEVHQGGVLLQRAQVDAGAFSLTDISPRNADADLEVTIIEDSGRRQYRLAPAQYRRATMALPGGTLTIGRQRPLGVPSALDDAALVAGSQAWRLPAADAVISAGALARDRYHSLALGLDHRAPGRNVATLSLRSVWANDARAGRAGRRNTVQLATRQAGWELHVGASQRSGGFREPHEARTTQGLPAACGHSEWQLSLGIGMASDRWGTFRGTYAPVQHASGWRSTRATASWSRRSGPGQLLATLERGGGLPGGRPQNVAALSFSMPLDRLYVRGTTKVRDGQARAGVEVSARTGTHGDWRVSAEHDRARGDTRLAAGFTALPRHAQLGGNASHGNDATRAMAQLSGGVVAHAQGLTLSPYRIGDTFGVIKAGDRAGVRVQTDSGTVWTDARGHAVVAALTPYRQARVQVDGRSLPAHVDLANGSRNVVARRGAVAGLDFELASTRRVLLRVVDGAGTVIGKGASVMADDHYVTTVVDDGHVFLTDYQPARALRIVLPDGSRCVLQPQLATPRPDGAFFEAGRATCRAE